MTEGQRAGSDEIISAAHSGPADELRFLEGGGEMGSAVRTLDWRNNPLGSPQSWSQPLRTLVALVLASPFPKCLVWGSDMISIYNDAFVPILGKKPSGIGRSFRDIWSEAWETIGPIADKAFAGQATFIEDFPLVVSRNGYPEQAYFTFSYSPVLDEFGQYAGFMDTVIESTAKVETERQLHLLNAELGHRMKNTQAIVQAIANQTFRTAVDSDTLGVFTQRLMALSSANDILLRQSWESAPLRTVMQNVLEPNFGNTRVRYAGPDITLGAKAVISMSLMLHEMATNALKHGALSVETGHIEIAWSIKGEGSNASLHVRWSEHGGPPAIQPTRHGFGSRLIRGGLMGAGKAQLHFLPTGLVGEFEAPVNWISAGEQP